MQQETSNKNVLFIICHDIGRRYGCYNNKHIHTPHVDSFAEGAVRFDQHFCQWPLCGPSRANIFSGQRPLTTQRFNNQAFFPHYRKRAVPGFSTLPELFKRNGYCSYGSGLVYHDIDDDASWSYPHWRPSKEKKSVPDWAEGWFTSEYLDEWKDQKSIDLMKQRLETLKQQGMTKEQFKDRANFRKARGPAFEHPDVDDTAYEDGQVARNVCSFLESYPTSENKDKPFFIGVGLVAAHTPFRAPAKYWDLYKDEELALPAFREWPEGSEPWMAGDSEPAQYYTQHGYEKPWKATDEQSKDLLHARYATISYIDSLIGSILSSLKKIGEYENTNIVLTTDHGFHDGQHGYWGKHNLWDQSLQVPLFIRVPGITDNGMVMSSLTEHVDIYPSVCDIAGIEKPDYLEGKSFWPIITGDLGQDDTNRVGPGDSSGSRRKSRPDPEKIHYKDAVFSHRKHQWHDRLQVYDIAHSVRTNRYRYTMYLDANSDLLGEELFDYFTDPEETRNHAADQSYTTIKNDLQERLKRFR